ncbi:MAG: trehalose-6-phosphate synthase [Novosphingobium sp. 16-62-11]|uniref:alpha,alpha-trehalose-phosphate synthase (UDP-forming) n=1 Tax=Novosphingobium sp. 17-62-19 TaxID=1970406 RepID=UPI000BD11B7F|nr:trehalose-6-phosphate synthase [Novosphingobium sp. 17-62-19]OYX93364.1 MAG: trehalose-6-phosphate synthase [Novosphingobium sp. 35-62-5]OYZ43569.1 MAG: trehalose-6-phosphate synthase [Novosphingobium sp. 16-62-11]OZA20032.1 MAG: trehalose-6-phosphate synthase [Novosphingobium sp. 17-62-19]HQS95969.1 trehalose-6-phosphate synthase [Novosphingobium sp.]
MSRLIVVSNRVSAGGGAQGGLAVALSAALRANGGIWFGWSGEVTDEFTGHINFQRTDGVATATVDLEEQDVEEYYDGYANRTLWPLFHYRIDLAEYERSFAGGYERANQRFAETVLPLIEPEDVVWVQDYHMIPLGRELRNRGVRNRIGFFLHIPWPPRRLLATLPEAAALVETLFAYDVIGFHTQEWLDSFVDFVKAEMGATVIDGVAHCNGRTAQLVACPIGIDAKAFGEMAESPAAREAHDQLKASLVGRSLIVGVDRLDYSKGLEERFLGYERFLEEHPEERKEVVLLQIAPPSRGAVESYQRIRSKLEGLAGRINGAHAALDWVPIRYVNQGYPRDVLAGVYRAAKIGLVTPLRDGMNLVAKEYVAAQDPEDPGVLILSRFAGAAEEMSDALLVNPYSAEEISDAIQRALVMPLAERKARWNAMIGNVRDRDVMWWLETFRNFLEAPSEDDAVAGAAPVNVVQIV